MATTFQTGEVDGEAYRHDGVFLSKRPEVWPSCELDEVSDDEKAPPNVLFAWKPGSRLSQWTRYRRVVHCLLEISRVQCFEGKAITQNLEITYE